MNNFIEKQTKSYLSAMVIFLCLAGLLIAQPVEETKYNQSPSNSSQALIQQWKLNGGKPPKIIPPPPAGLPFQKPTGPPPSFPTQPSAPQGVTGTGKNYGYLTLRLEPLTLKLKEGEKGKQSIVLDNPRGVSVDDVEIIIKYSTKYLDIIDMDSDLPGVNLESDNRLAHNVGVQVILNLVDTEKGIIQFRLKAMTKDAYVGGKIATIRMVGKKRCLYTPLEFMFPKSINLPGTKVTRNNHDILGWDNDPKDGIISGGVTVLGKP